MNKWHKLALRELALMFGIFRQPAATIAALRRETRWLIPFGMLLLVVFINARLTQEIAALEFDDLLQSLLQFTGEGEALPEEDPLAAPDLMTQLLLLGGVTLLGRWLLALLLRFVSRVFLRREVSFRLLFTFSIYLGYIHAAGIILRLPLQLLSGSVRTTLGPSLLLRQPTGFIQYFFAHLDLFHLWEAGLAGLGLGLLTETDDHLRPAVIVVGFYLLWNILGALSASAIIG